MERLVKGAGLADAATGRVPSGLLLPGAERQLERLTMTNPDIPHYTHDPRGVPEGHIKDHLQGGGLNPEQALDATGQPHDVVTTGFITAPHYGGGHEGLDSKDHFANGIVNIDSSAPLEDKPVDVGGAAIPHYGGGHEDMDTFEHMDMALIPGGDAATFDLATGSTIVPHYGHGHEDKDTVDHFKAGTLEAEIEADMYVHYGGESRATHEASSLGAGMVPTKDDDAKYTKIFKQQKKTKPMGAPGQGSTTLTRSFRSDRLARIQKFKAIKQARSPSPALATDARSPPNKRMRASARAPLPAIKSPAAAARQYFIAIPTFEGAKPGYLFKKGKLGVGYYLDLGPEELEAYEALPSETAARPQTKKGSASPAKSGSAKPAAAEYVQLSGSASASSAPKAKLDTFAHMRDGYVDEENVSKRVAEKPSQSDTFAHMKTLPSTVKVVTTIAQKYGGGHETDDSFDHFEKDSMQLNGTGERTKTNQFGNHYGGGHEDMDTFSHMDPQAMKPTDDGSMTFSEMVDGHLGAHELVVKDHTHVGTLIPDIEEKNIMSGLTVAPHYGHGHEDKDTFEHMNQAFMPSQEGSKSKTEDFGNHYGGGHENADTFSHMDSDMVPRATVPKKTAYGEEARDILMKKHTHPRKAKMVFGGTVQLTKHDLNQDTRYADSSAKRKGRRLNKGEKGTFPQSRFAEDDATIFEDDQLKTAPWFAKSLAGKPSPEPMAFPGYVRTSITRERAVTGKRGRSVSAV